MDPRPRTASRRRIAGATAAALAALALGAAAPARSESTGGPNRAKASIDFAVVIPLFLRSKVVSQPASLPVRREDLERGYVDVDGAAAVALASNSPSGYQVRVGFDPRLVARAVVRIDGRAFAADGPGRAFRVEEPLHGTTSVRIGYRLYLAPAAREGTYGWPVALSFTPGA